MGDFTPRASFAAGEFAMPPGDFTSTTGVWKPSAPGKYVLSFMQWHAQGAAICKNGAVPPVVPTVTSAPASVPQGCAMGWGTTYGGRVVAVFDANGTSDYFKLYVYLGSGQFVRGGATHYTYFSGSRVGTPVNVTREELGTKVDLPAGAVQFFNRTTCPTGWTLMNGQNGTIDMQGLYVVGSERSAASVGQLPTGTFTRLGDLENRSTGQHSHPIPGLALNTLTVPALTYTKTYNHWFGPYNADQGTSDVLGMENTYHADSTQMEDNYYNTPIGTPLGGTPLPKIDITNAVTVASVTQSPAGPVAGTNAPYVQLLACKKN